MKKLLEECEARLEPHEIETIWQNVQPGARRRALAAWPRPLLAAAAVLMLLLGGGGIWWQMVRAPRTLKSEMQPVARQTPPAEVNNLAPGSAAELAVPHAASDGRSVAALPQPRTPDPTSPKPAERESGPRREDAAAPDQIPPASATLAANPPGENLGVGDAISSAPPAVPPAVAENAITQTTDDGSAGSAMLPIPKMTWSEVKTSGPPVNSGTTREVVSRMFVSPQNLQALPVDRLNAATELKAGTAPNAGELHFRGGRSGDVTYQVDGKWVGGKWIDAPRPQLPNSVGGTDPVNGEPFDAMFFKHYGSIRSSTRSTTGWPRSRWTWTTRPTR